MIINLLKRNKYSLLTLAFVAVVLGVWEIAATALDKEYILPKFSAVFMEFIRLFGDKLFYADLGATLLRAVIGFSCAFVLGLALGILGGKFKTVDSFMKPIAAFLRSTPVMALTLLIMIWFRAKITPMVIGFMLVFPVVYASVKEGILSVDPKILQMAKVYKFGKKEKLRYIYLPHLAPTLFSTAITCFGLNLKAVISAEILSYAPRSLGIAMYIAKSDIFEGTALLFAYVCVAVIISALFEVIMTFVKKRVCKNIV